MDEIQNTKLNFNIFLGVLPSKLLWQHARNKPPGSASNKQQSPVEKQRQRQKEKRETLLRLQKIGLYLIQVIKKSPYPSRELEFSLTLKGTNFRNKEIKIRPTPLDNNSIEFVVTRKSFGSHDTQTLTYTFDKRTGKYKKCVFSIEDWGKGTPKFTNKVLPHGWILAEMDFKRFKAAIKRELAKAIKQKRKLGF